MSNLPLKGLQNLPTPHIRQPLTPGVIPQLSHSIPGADSLLYQALQAKPQSSFQNTKPQTFSDLNFDSPCQELTYLNVYPYLSFTGTEQIFIEFDPTLLKDHRDARPTKLRHSQLVPLFDIRPGIRAFSLKVFPPWP